MLLEVGREDLPASVILVGAGLFEVGHEGVKDLHGEGELGLSNVFEAAEGDDVFDWLVDWWIFMVGLDEIGREVNVWVV